MPGAAIVTLHAIETMDLPESLEEGTFIRRVNRFAAEVRLRAGLIRAHVPNSGRLGELLVAGAQVLVHPAARPGRKTSHDLVLVRHGGVLVHIDSRAPAKLAAEAFCRRDIPPVPRAETVKREIAFGDGRIDLHVSAFGCEWLVEVKGCTLVRDGAAMFPDAPTTRGRRHVEDLSRFAQDGGRAMVLFVIQRSDAHCFRPNREADPAFARALGEAAEVGVSIAAYTCRVSRRRVTLWREVPVTLE